MRLKINFFLTALLCSSVEVFAQRPPIDKAYKLVFQDEFDRRIPITGIDASKWNRTPPWNQSSNKTVDASWCFPGDTTKVYWDRAYVMRDLADSTTIKVNNGTCKFITNKTPYKGRVSNWPPCDPAKPGYAIGGSKCQEACSTPGKDGISRCRTNDTLDFKYTTGMLFSKDKFKYGYFEIRFRLPANPAPPFNYQGFGPNFWLWGNNPQGDRPSEIDIFEIIAFNPAKADSNRYTSTVRYSEKNHGNMPSAHSEALGNFLKNDTSWHIAAAWWTPEFVKFYMDDSLFFTVENRPDIPLNKLEEQHIIIDVNAPNPGRCNNFDPDRTFFPYVYEVDFVRVYQEK